jgi:hypothetical protein
MARRLFIALLLVSLCVPVAGPVAGAAPRVLYVDGKTGSDADAGTSLGSAFKTIGKAMQELYRENFGRVADHVQVVGYNDYTYYEKSTGSVYMPGTSASPVIVEAYQFGSAGYVRPIVSGALEIKKGDARWYRPNAAQYPDVWAIPWSTPIPGYESSAIASRQERLFMDTSQPLVRPATAPTLAQLQAAPASQYWNGSVLYVRLGLWSGSTSSDPKLHTISIPYYKGLLVGTGSAYVTMRGFRIRHTTMAVGFTGNAHHNTADGIDASYNYGMGFWTASNNNIFRNVSGSRNTIQLIKLDNGAQHNLVEYATGIENLGQGVKLTGANNAFNTIRYSTFRDGLNVPVNAGQYGGYIQGVLIEHGAHDNVVYSNTISRMRRGVYLYGISSSGMPLSGNQFKYNLFANNATAVYIWDSRSGSASTGNVTFYRNTYADNGYAVITSGATSNKSFNHETIYNSTPNAGMGAFYVSGSGGSVSLSNSIVFRSSAYGIRADSGSRAYVTYTTVVATSGPRVGGVVWDGSDQVVDPQFLSLVASSPDYLTIASSSPVYVDGSRGDPLGSRWK